MASPPSHAPARARPATSGWRCRGPDLRVLGPWPGSRCPRAAMGGALLETSWLARPSGGAGLDDSGQASCLSLLPCGPRPAALRGVGRMLGNAATGRFSASGRYSDPPVARASRCFLGCVHSHRTMWFLLHLRRLRRASFGTERVRVSRSTASFVSGSVPRKIAVWHQHLPGSPWLAGLMLCAFACRPPGRRSRRAAGRPPPLGAGGGLGSARLECSSFALPAGSPGSGVAVVPGLAVSAGSGVALSPRASCRDAWPR